MWISAMGNPAVHVVGIGRQEPLLRSFYTCQPLLELGRYSRSRTSSVSSVVHLVDATGFPFPLAIVTTGGRSLDKALIFVRAGTSFSLIVLR